MAGSGCGRCRWRAGGSGFRPFLATGFLGAYTTYSTFAVETDLLIRNGHWPIALAYVVASFATGFMAVSAGIALGRKL